MLLKILCSCRTSSLHVGCVGVTVLVRVLISCIMHEEGQDCGAEDGAANMWYQDCCFLLLLSIAFHLL